MLKQLTAAALLSVSMLSSGCLVTSGSISGISVRSVPAQLVESGGILGDLLGLVGMEFPFSASALGSAAAYEGTTAIYVEELALRTLFETPEDQTPEAMEDPTLVAACRPGQKPITWIHSMTIKVQRAGAPETAQVLAHHSFPESQQDANGICGFFFDLESVNLMDYLPDYELVVDAEGRPPREDTWIGGFATLTFDGEYGLELPPPGQDEGDGGAAPEAP